VSEVGAMISSSLARYAVLAASAVLLLGSTVSRSHPVKTAPPVKAPRSFELYSVAFASPAHGWVGGNGMIFATVDGGAHWKQQFTGHLNVYAMTFIDEQRGWAAGMDPIWGTGVLLGTGDGGAHWNRLGEPPHPIRSLSFVDGSNGIGIAGGSLVRFAPAEWGTPPFIGGRIVATHDGGHTWSVIETPQAADSACLSDSSHGWTGNQGSVQRSIDGGATWHHVLAAGVDPYRTWSARVACASPQVIWALFETTDAISGAQGRPFIVYRSADAGEHWAPVLLNTGASAAYRGIQAAAAPTVDAAPFAVSGPSHALFLGFTAPNVTQGNGISALVTNDGGGSWQPQRTVPAFSPTSAVAISAPSATRAWVVGTVQGRGRIFTTADGGRSWTEQFIR
jgi:photosystem II stability/assembly factor-like uncharacterized protein